jgi:uncharacterized protein (TIGR00269 family)
MKCDKCSAHAIIYQEYSGMHLCRRHFVEDVERKIKKSIRGYSMIEKNDRIAVALSGGKDSTVLLHVLCEIFHDRKDIEFITISIDEGIRGYRDNAIGLTKESTENLGVEHFVFSFEDEYGISIDEIANSDRSPCTYCGVLRKNILDRKARELGMTKIATGHNLDDESQTILMDYLRGDIARLARGFTTNLDRFTKGESERSFGTRPKRDRVFVPRIKPLRNIPEEEVMLYGFVKGFSPFTTGRCPYANLSFRSEIRDMINEIEMKHPGTRYSLIRGFERILDLDGGKSVSKSLSTCEICGEPCSGSICNACLLLLDRFAVGTQPKFHMQP